VPLTSGSSFHLPKRALADLNKTGMEGLTGNPVSCSPSFALSVCCWLCKSEPAASKTALPAAWLGAPVLELAFENEQALWVIFRYQRGVAQPFVRVPFSTALYRDVHAHTRTCRSTSKVPRGGIAWLSLLWSAPSCRTKARRAVCPGSHSQLVTDRKK